MSVPWRRLILLADFSPGHVKANSFTSTHTYLVIGCKHAVLVGSSVSVWNAVHCKIFDEEQGAAVEPARVAWGYDQGHGRCSCNAGEKGRESALAIGCSIF